MKSRNPTHEQKATKFLKTKNSILILILDIQIPISRFSKIKKIYPKLKNRSVQSLYTHVPPNWPKHPYPPAFPGTHTHTTTTKTTTMGKNIFDLLQQKLELFRLEQKYTRSRNRRSTFVSEAQYVDGEYIYTVPKGMGAMGTGDSTDSSKTNESSESTGSEKKRRRMR